MPPPIRRPSPLFLLMLAPLAGCAGLGRAVHVPVNLISHELCSTAFISEVDPERFYDEELAPQVAPIAALLRHHVDYDARTASASLAGRAESRAIYHDGLGCIVDQGVTPPPVPALAPEPPAGPPLLEAGAAVAEPADPALKAALDQAFAEPPKGPRRNTHAVVVVKDGRVIAERYAPGYGVMTRLHGWSMTKSATNALLGILVREGRLEMDAPAPVAAWSAPGDPRGKITPDDLLRMRSGLALGQSLTASWTSAFDEAAQSLFATPDQAARAEAARLQAAPGTRWRYADGSTAILARIVTDKAGGPAAVQAFARRELFDKLGMGPVVLETDATGAPFGSTHVWASARDWARLGLLFANDGVVNGERILPEGWVDYSARLTPGSEAYGYGAGFWTERGAPRAHTFRPHLPADAFMARGSRGQYVVIVPSRRLVVVRMGEAYTPREDMGAVDRLVGEVIAATGG
ncbi:serine hydrolase [Phenylobacterium sp.]|uniref:serine hydrolase n=1 Tax=Phenylobacterium sp. TaxID=1871053 RepID=UPI0035AE4630